jgi:hypothetical protein
MELMDHTDCHRWHGRHRAGIRAAARKRRRHRHRHRPRPARGEQAVAAIGADARFVQTDMADADSMNSLVQQCGAVDISSTTPRWRRSKEFRARPDTAPPKPRWNRSPAPGPPSSGRPGCE